MMILRASWSSATKWHARLSLRSFGPPAVRRDPNLLSGAARGALDRNREEEELRTLPDLATRDSPDAADAERSVIIRSYNRPAMRAPPAQAYPAHPFNFTPLRPVPRGFSAADRAVREVPWESRFDLVQRKISPRYCSECAGTPRRELQDGMVGGVRVRPVQNPYVKLTPARRYRLNSWASKNWDAWMPSRCYIRGSKRRYRVPEDITPYKDELGEWHKPRVSGRYKADIEKQYYMHSLPWVWANDFYRGKQHFMDREPRGQKYWYKKEYRKAHVAEALRRADTMIEEYRKERREAKRLSWSEEITLAFAGEQLAAPYIRQRRLPKF